MKPLHRRIRIFRDAHPLIGPIFWMLSVQYFVTQAIVAAGWQTPLSLRSNAISDLGNSACASYSNRFVCSPYYSYMNSSFVVLGLAMILGCFFIYPEFRERRHGGIGFACMALAGVGSIVVGLFPENTIGSFHLTGAALSFFFGNIALIIFSFSLNLPAIFAWLTRLLGIGALIGLILLLKGQYLGLGFGGMERVVAYPQTVWLILFGLYMSANRYMRLD